MALGTEIALIKALGGGGSSLPAVTSSDAGKVLAVDNSGVWGASEPIGKRFIVTLTPTNPTEPYYGTTDKTTTEIGAAYDSKQDIWFDAQGLGYDHYYVRVTDFIDNRSHFSDENEITVQGVIIDNVGGVVFLGKCRVIYDLNNTVYVIDPYPLTPAI